MAESQNNYSVGKTPEENKSTQLMIPLILKRKSLKADEFTVVEQSFVTVQGGHSSRAKRRRGYQEPGESF